MKKLINLIFNSFGLELSKYVPLEKLPGAPVELSFDELSIIREVVKNKLSMASLPRLYATALACKYVALNNIDGDFVECGVWRGGNSIIAAKIFQLYGLQKEMWLFDTFKGMTKPTALDNEISTKHNAIFEFSAKKRDGGSSWCYCPLENVKRNLLSFGLNSTKLKFKFIKGDINKSLNNSKNIPPKISILRLDTDWYVSTKKEMTVLYPKLVKNGVLLLDDYGHWDGARRAVDEYIQKLKKKPLIVYNDRSGRTAIKN